MIGGLFFVNALLASIILFTTSMLQHHFARLEKSINIYTDPKVYKPERETEFISKLIERCKVLHLEGTQNLDIETMILRAFYEEKIGKFSYIQVQGIAVQGKIALWTILITQIAFEILGRNPGQSITHFIYIVASTFLCMLITSINVIKNVVGQRNQLLIKVQDYIVNAYPAELSWKNKQKNIKELLNKIEKLETELESYQTNEEMQTETIKVNKGINAALKEEDIKSLLEKFNLNA